MKNFFIGFAATLFVTACNSKTKESESTNVLTTDTSSLYNNGISSDTATTTESVAVPQRDTVYLPAPKRVEAAKTNRTALRSTKTSTPAKSTTSQTTSASTSTGTAPAKDTVSTVPSTANTPTASEKKGMSNSTKGAILGGVGGAVGGAIISKKKGKGAIIGGAVGAAGGYILGRKKDKKQAAPDTIPQ